MDKIRIRGMIQFLFLEGNTAKEIHNRIAPTLDDSFPLGECLKRGRTSIEDAPRLRTSKSAVMSKNIDKVHDIILATGK